MKKVAIQGTLGSYHDIATYKPLVKDYPRD